MNINIKRFFLTIVLPTLLTIGLFIMLIFRFIIPYFEQNMINQKKETIRELVSSAVSIARSHYDRAVLEQISEETARQEAIRQIGSIRYGIENKDYCWITDTRPFMIEHPYRPDLNGTDLTDFTDPQGKRMFVEMVQSTRMSGEGYVDYMWQWMDDPSRIVPKISYVREFKPWGWIIGTGIYIEDIRQEISAIQKKLLGVLLLITAAMALLLTFIVRQHLKTEIRRSQAEAELLDSRERYKALVEASSEGTWMIVEGETIYYSRKLQDIIPEVDRVRLSPDFREIIDPERAEDLQQIKAFISSPQTALRLETRINGSGSAPVNAILAICKITLSDRQGYILTIKELGTPHESDSLRELAETLNLGYFQASPGKSGRFLSLCTAAVKALGHQRSELLSMPISHLAAEAKEWLKMLRKLDRNGAISGYKLGIKTVENGIRTVEISARIVKDDQGTILYSDGFITDLSDQYEAQQAMVEAMDYAHNLLLQLHQPIEHVMKESSSCSARTTIRQAAELMREGRTDHLLVRDNDMTPIGLISQGDLVRRVLLGGIDPETGVTQAMSAPLISSDSRERIVDAWDTMHRLRFKQLAVRNGQGQLAGTVSRCQIDALLLNPLCLIPPQTAEDADRDNLKARVSQLPLVLSPLIRSGCHSQWLTTISTALADQALQLAARLMEKELGPPPVPYTLIVLGSLGRKEPTLTSDQDNALVYQDPEPEEAERCSLYFHRLAEGINLLLAEMGYPLCPGEIMARNPLWNQSLKKWKQTVLQWIRQPDPKNLMVMGTFFDLRPGYGSCELFAELKEHIQNSFQHHPALSALLARECMQYKIPLGMFGKIITEEDENEGSRLNLKPPLRVLVNLVRLYALSNGIAESNTILRLRTLRDKSILSEQFCRGIEFAYDFLNRRLFASQIMAHIRHEPPSSGIDLNPLSEIEIAVVKMVFNEITNFQNRLKHDFSISE